MGLTFASPLVLGALAAIAVPVLVHLVDREESGGRRFPSLMLLSRMQFDTARRRALRDRGLLALRALAIALLAWAFAGPQLEWPAVAGSTAEPGRTVWLVDTSYSMQPPARWRAARDAVRRDLAQWDGGGEGLLLAFDREVRVVAGPTRDRGVIASALANLAPRAKGTGLRAAIEEAARLAAERPGAARVVVVSDLQASAMAAHESVTLPAGVLLEVTAVGGAIGANLAILDARPRAAPDLRGANLRIAVRMRNTGDAAVVERRVQVWLDERAGPVRAVSLAPGAEEVLDFEVLAPTGVANRIRVESQADPIPADDRFHLVSSGSNALRVLRIRDDAVAPARDLFIEQALAVSLAPSIVHEAVGVSEFPARTLDGIDVVIAHDVALSGDDVAARLSAFVRAGGGLVVLAGDGIGERWPGEGDGVFPGRLGARRTAGAAGAGVLTIDGAHPLWTVDPELTPAALRGIRVRHHRGLTARPGDRVVARLDGGDPLLVERESGVGRVLALTTTDDPRWGTLALDGAFAPLLAALVRHAAGRPPPTPAALAGDAVDLARNASALSGGRAWRAWLAAGGQAWLTSPGAQSRQLGPGQRFAVLESPGFHEVHGPREAEALPLAVNVDRAESILAPIEVADLLARVSRAGAAPGSGGAAAPHGQRVDLHWYIMAVLLGLLLLESVVATRTARPGSVRREGVIR